jgi:PadR family transcriptional regulator PadR
MPRRPLETQTLSRSCNEALILATLSDGARHGYEIALEIERRGGGYFHFRHVTLYPILHQLERDGLIKGSWSEEGPRGKRKLYALTRKGRRHADEQREAWRVFVEHFFAVMGEVTP